MSVPTDHTPCLWEWTTPDDTNVRRGAVLKHICTSPAGHSMEHCCRCGELYPS